VEVVLSPKSQDQEAGELNELSLNWTVSGAFPLVLFAEKFPNGLRPDAAGDVVPYVRIAKLSQYAICPPVTPSVFVLTSPMEVIFPVMVPVARRTPFS